ncbi:hypothetical protein ACKI2D_48805, partial [Streptomyces europaeiscabiei]
MHEAEEKLFEIYDADLTGDEEDTQMSAVEAAAKMPYGFSAARTRCIELTARLLYGKTGKLGLLWLVGWVDMGTEPGADCE